MHFKLIIISKIIFLKYIVHCVFLLQQFLFSTILPYKIFFILIIKLFGYSLKFCSWGKHPTCLILITALHLICHSLWHLHPLAWCSTQKVYGTSCLLVALVYYVTSYIGSILKKKFSIWLAWITSLSTETDFPMPSTTRCLGKWSISEAKAFVNVP